MYVFINYAILRVIMRRAAGEVLGKKSEKNGQKGEKLRVRLFDESLSLSLFYSLDEKSSREQLG